MSTVNKRLRDLRGELNIKQGDFAKKISTTQGHISDIENERKNLSERTIKLICLENWNGRFVNEEWLRNGFGDMFIELPEEDEVAGLVSDLLEDKDNPFHKMIIGTMRTFKKLTPENQKVLISYCKQLFEELQEKGD